MTVYRHPATTPEMLEALVDNLGGAFRLARALGTQPHTVRRWLAGGAAPTLIHQRDLGLIHAAYAPSADVRAVLDALRRDAAAFEAAWRDALCDELPPREAKPIHDRYLLSRDWLRAYERRAATPRAGCVETSVQSHRRSSL
jgi:hypothetical protein